MWDLKAIKKVKKGFDYFKVDKPKKEDAIYFEGVNLNTFDFDLPYLGGEKWWRGQPPALIGKKRS